MAEASPKADENTVAKADGGQKGDDADAKPQSPPSPELNPKMFVAPAVMLGLRYFKIDVNQYLDQLRIAFAVVVFLNFLSMFVVYLRSQSPGKGDEKIEVKEKKMDGTTARRSMTVREYDASEVKKKAGQALFALAITCGIHYKWGNGTPLLFQALMTPLGIFEDPLFRIHVLGYAAEGKLERPFKPPPSPFADLAGQDDDKDDQSSAVTEKKKRSKHDKKRD